MKTETKSKIVQIIKKKGPIRPAELVRLLGVSPQAVHRHLNFWVSQGVLERKGKAPSTQYMMADVPHFESALHWYQSTTATSVPNLCETRDRFAARLDHFIPLEKKGFSKGDLSLIISTSGEIGNNSFDHNMGQWKDVPGCWFEIQLTRNQLWVLIADRGQGIYKSISKVITDLQDEASAVKRVFEETISGRSPEKRGNGLKYVRENLSKTAGRGVACLSGSGSIYYGDLGDSCFNVLQSIPNQKFGTITLMAWALK